MHVSGLYKLPNPDHGTVLFKALIVEVVIISVSGFAAYVSNESKEHSADLSFIGTWNLASIPPQAGLKIQKNNSRNNRLHIYPVQQSQTLGQYSRLINDCENMDERYVGGSCLDDINELIVSIDSSENIHLVATGMKSNLTDKIIYRILNNNQIRFELSGGKHKILWNYKKLGDDHYLVTSEDAQILIDLRVTKEEILATFKLGKDSDTQDFLAVFKRRS
jgi:hypothetical protein